ncbi:hypothetical protein JCM12294_24810 [Desulfocicer niacini]
MIYHLSVPGCSILCMLPRENGKLKTAGSLNSAMADVMIRLFNNSATGDDIDGFFNSKLRIADAGELY